MYKPSITNFSLFGPSLYFWHRQIAMVEYVRVNLFYILYAGLPNSFFYALIEFGRIVHLKEPKRKAFKNLPEVFL